MRTDRPPDPVHRVDENSSLRADRSPVGVVKRAAAGFGRHGLLDWAAALTYYSVLSIFPGLLVLVSLLGLTGASTTDTLVDEITRFAPGAAGDILVDQVRNLQESSSTASFFAIVGLAAALWSASGYVGAFMRASNTIHEVPEGRPVWWVWPVRIAVTVTTGVLLTVCSFLVVFTGGLARWLGRLIGIGDTFATVWDIAKWPVLVVLMSLILAVLYWAAPNVSSRFSLVGWGSLTAIVLWGAASAGFALYVANFASYNETYGALGGVIVFLVWLWISNIAVLFGAQLDTEMRRRRSAGEPRLRSTRKVDEKEVAVEKATAD